jgi:malate dehydrogenase (quinone)
LGNFDKKNPMQDTLITKPVVVLIGAGIMRSTLGVFLKELEPSLTVAMLGRGDDLVDLARSNSWA